MKIVNFNLNNRHPFGICLHWARPSIGTKQTAAAAAVSKATWRGILPAEWNETDLFVGLSQIKQNLSLNFILPIKQQTTRCLRYHSDRTVNQTI